MVTDILYTYLIVAGPSSKFRHIQGAVLHRDTHITNLRGMSLTTPGECDGFSANGQRVAVPLATAGGQIAVLEVIHNCLCQKCTVRDSMNERP